MKKKIAPYGSWKSPITADLIVARSISFGQIALDGDDIYWIERRPQEKGRGVIVKRDKRGKTIDLVPQPFNVRTRAHEYGGGDYVVSDGVVYFSNFVDQNIYRLSPKKKPENLTKTENICYADFITDERRNRLICVQEDRSVKGKEATNSLIALDLKNGKKKTLVQGNDFYSSPKLSADGKKLTWLTWNHPNMPWDGCELWITNLTVKGELTGAHKIAGGESESIFQPEWSPDGLLYFISDRNNWWNLYRYNNNRIEIVFEIDAELGLPQWVFGMSTHGFISAEQIICRYKKDGEFHLVLLDTKTKKTKRMPVPFNGISEIRVQENHAVMDVTYPAAPMALVKLDLRSKKISTLRESSSLKVNPSYISCARAISFPTTNKQIAYAYFYPPTNGDYLGPKGELPPLIVKIHGGPTSAASDGFSLTVQYWTSRGFAVVDVNYRGSTGFGRKYRELLREQWGVVDTEDAVAAAKYLAQKKLVDPNRLAITGGSAGGYTVLSALTFHDVFHAGASHFGVSDLELLNKEIHKFESRYLDGLIGPYPAMKKRYKDRSPIHSAHKLSRPVIFFQGLEDLIVPPNQAERMVEVLKKKGIPVSYVTFAGEQHGFRQAANIKKAIEGEYYFYSRIFRFELSEEISAVSIDNL